jgi:ubiquitin carboxyl-terminal hydrolase 7
VQWKFAFLSLGRPEYLQDGDIVASRFQVGGVGFDESLMVNSGVVMQKRDTYGAWEHYLGLEHADMAPKRSHAANQVTIFSHCIVILVFKRR